MQAETEVRYCFRGDWYDPNAALIREYYLIFFPKDSTAEMYDIKNKRTFLKRSKVDSLSLEDLHLGALINIYSRELKIVDYGDSFTASQLGPTKERTYAMIKPDAFSKLGEIVDIIVADGFKICNLKSIQLSRKEAAEFYSEHEGKHFFNTLLDFMTSGPVLGMELMRSNAIKRWRELLGPTNSSKARQEAPNSIRARYGTDGTQNACHGSDSTDSAAREIEFIFPTNGGRRRNTAKFTECTLAIVKPRAVAEKLTGKILRSISDQGFEISSLYMCTLERANAEELLQIYKGVVAEYTEMVSEFSSGPCIAIEIRGNNAPQNFREFCGPADPEIARQLRPNSLRARFGKDKIRNAVHCSDLPDDGLLEVEYFFKILDN
ncbi:Nucleoside diphosphate kinase 7 [Trichoplax sp. H2]|nr:Nucleoside diphosphate kinase 7 [Trichoplax sp. H2]|eukprot:RDD38465.1 Nucleoside diphosphate kinase 7 [Trichoplax sp. H2]